MNLSRNALSDSTYIFISFVTNSCIKKIVFDVSTHFSAVKSVVVAIACNVFKQLSMQVHFSYGKDQVSLTQCKRSQQIYSLDSKSILMKMKRTGTTGEQLSNLHIF
jgi:hypothetical protein